MPTWPTIAEVDAADSAQVLHWINHLDRVRTDEQMAIIKRIYERRREHVQAAMQTEAKPRTLPMPPKPEAPAKPKPAKPKPAEPEPVDPNFFKSLLSR